MALFLKATSSSA
ncbi:hypothetical protein VTL71DRAFT_9409 [Oculimacula yallundae]|uniref:Uncharacterized protein n=1 Tax=Oculimacula yallundae TaxID=86028 RepID=A0ABR4BTS7_9HELO